MLKNESEVRKVYGLKQEEYDAIFYFLQGAVYCWCKNRPKEWFALRDLMGGDNYFWQGTPLMRLYDKHADNGKSPEEAVKSAAKDAGWLLKKVIVKDDRKFETCKEELTRKYKWLKEG